MVVGAAEDEARRPTVAPILLVLGPRQSCRFGQDVLGRGVTSRVG
jgi:hypothetical protein